MAHPIIPVVVLTVVFISIAVRQIGTIRLEIWQIMLLGALAVLLTKSISVQSAYQAIDAHVLLFLFGMFVIGRALEESGEVEHISSMIFRQVRSVDALIVRILLFMGFASAFFMNDTIAIIGTPLMLLLAKKHGIQPRVLLLTLAFAITTGSVMSPIGNPQNFLIALHGNVPDPFLTFFKYLFLPTILNLFAAYFVIKTVYRDELHPRRLHHVYEPVRDKKLAALSRYSLVLVIVLALLKTVVGLWEPFWNFDLSLIALVGALPILIFSSKRVELMKYIDWTTLVFFAAMFVLMKSVWNTGVFQRLIGTTGSGITTVHSVLGISVLLSQLISNVPMVALYLPVLLNAAAPLKAFIALAAGSTVAGNLLILGAASNIIIIQTSEKRSGRSITFFEFAKAGIPLTIMNIAVYWFFLKIV